MNKTILIADDNKDIADILSVYVNKEGYTPIIAYDGEDALMRFESANPALVLLDVMMPKKNGYDVCREIRKSSNTPVIMITARVEDADKIMGLDIGADDYITKPFSPAEVMARVRAVLRRLSPTEKQPAEIKAFPFLEINLTDFDVRVDGIVVNLTKKETEILWLLASHPGRIFSRDHLLDSLWGADYYGDPRTVDTHMGRLRSKLNIQDHYPWDIKTIWGMGYKFEVRDV